MAREADAGRPIGARAQGRGGGGDRPSGEVQAPKRRFSFLHESWAELKKVEWPGQNQVIQGTVVVLVACVIVGVYLYANDALWKVVVQKVFLR